MREGENQIERREGGKEKSYGEERTESCVCRVQDVP